MKRLLISILVVLLVSPQAGCLKKFTNAMTKKRAKDAFMEHGPIENHGARCDNVINDLAYAEVNGSSERLTLDVYYDDHQGLAPIIVNIHGGGWAIGDKKDPNSVYRSKFLAANGYVVASINYRLLPDAPIEEQIEDVMAAVIWMKENAEQFGADPYRVGVTGGSAGGHLAAMVAWASDDPFFTPTGMQDPQFDSDVLAAVIFYGAVDLEKTLALDNEYLAPYSHAYFTGENSPEAREELFKHISAIYHADSTAVPSLFICGVQDEFNLQPDNNKLAKELRKQGVPAMMVTPKGANHGFDSDHGTRNSKRAMKAMTVWFDKFVKMEQEEQKPSAIPGINIRPR